MYKNNRQGRNRDIEQQIISLLDGIGNNTSANVSRDLYKIGHLRRTHRAAARAMFTFFDRLERTIQRRYKGMVKDYPAYRDILDYHDRLAAFFHGEITRIHNLHWRLPRQFRAQNKAAARRRLVQSTIYQETRKIGGYHGKA